MRLSLTKIVGIVILVGAALGASFYLVKNERKSTLGKVRPLSKGEFLPIIDVHIHAIFDGRVAKESGISAQEEQLIKEMKDAGVVGAVSHMGRAGDNYDETPNKHGIIQCYGVGESINLAFVEAGLKDKKFRCIKIYLGYVYRYTYDKEHQGIYRLAEKYNVPVVFHTGDTYSTNGKLKYSDPLTIDEVAVDYPKVNFVIAHMGNPWTQSAAEIAYKNPNVYVEASAMMIGDLKRVHPDGIQRYIVEPIRWAFGYIEDPEKLMFGTDWPLTGMKDYVEAYKMAIPREHWCDVFFNNAVRVFHMEEHAKKYKCSVKP